MGEDSRAVALDMLIEPDAGAGLGHDRCERGLADLKRIAPKVVASAGNSAQATYALGTKGPTGPTPPRTYGTRGAPPATYAGNTAFTPGSGGQPYAVTPGTYAANSAQPNEWYGPMRRGNMCTTHVDINRGYAYETPCKK